MMTIARTGWTAGAALACLLVAMGFGVMAGMGNAWAQEDQVDDGLKVMQAFTELEREESDLVKIELEKKRIIMFTMGVFLLIGVITTAGLGIAMVLFGKQVFVAHMIFAGFSVFLSIAHAVTAIVWFFPFYR